MKHENIIKYYDSFIRKNKLYIIMEIAEGGDLKMLIKEKIESKTKFDEETVIILINRYGNGLASYVHQLTIFIKKIFCTEILNQETYF